MKVSKLLLFSLTLLLALPAAPQQTRPQRSRLRADSRPATHPLFRRG